ncbi:MAG: response regulator [Opitutaceae bacterium]|nr:response regulator [Opitutaceae bacterium]
MALPENHPTLPLLIVDDEARVLAALKDVLERQGFVVVTASDPRRALALLEERPFSVVLSDQVMPVMSGMDFLVECQRIRPQATRVLITGALSLPTLVDAINRGEIFRFLAKPWLREELIATVRNAINRHELVVQNARLLAEAEELNRRLAGINATLAEQVVTLEAQRRELDGAQRELARRYDHSLELCTRILSTFDPLLAGQTRAIVDIVSQMTQAERFTAEEREIIKSAAWLCDLGLIGVHRDVLKTFRQDPSRLDKAALDSIHNHPIYSQTLAGYLDGRTLLGETIRAHHERFDGGGFPDGISGESIPWTARCLAVAVWFVECGLGPERAVDALQAEAGRALDPAAVRLFVVTTRFKTLPRPVREVELDELKPGMVLATGIYSPHGLLLVGEGQALNSATISKIRSHQLMEHFGTNLLVYL